MEVARCSSFEDVSVTLQPPLTLHEDEARRDLKIAEVRKSLAHLRKSWAQQGRQGAPPMYLCETIQLKEGLSIQVDAFALRFVLGHHQKRRSAPR